MPQELYWIYALNIIVNSLFSFFTTLLLVELVLGGLRIKHPKVKALCRSLPFIKICLDFSLYHFANWALCHGLNPLFASGTRQFSLFIHPFTGIQFSMQGGKTFSLADVIALTVGPFWTRVIVLSLATGTCIALVLKLIQIIQEKRKIARILQSATPLFLPLRASLREELEKKEIHCFATESIHSPCILGKTILFPRDLIEKLSSEEIEAILAHEIGHAQGRDGAVRLTCSFIAAFFWWIPTKKWQSRIEEMQEQAADLRIHRFGISKFALGEAVVKTAHYSREASSQLAFFFATRRPSFKNRLQQIIEGPNQGPYKQPFGLKTIQYGVMGIFLLSILFGKLWIF